VVGTYLHITNLDSELVTDKLVMSSNEISNINALMKYFQFSPRSVITYENCISLEAYEYATKWLKGVDLGIEEPTGHESTRTRIAQATSFASK
jgi:hypothetical protein